MNNERMSVYDCQRIELEIMSAIHRFCKDEGLRYLLSYGSLLGAVRHHGFIPWDNDMDIVMPRSDFEKLLILLKNTMLENRYYLLHWTTDERYHYQCARICDSHTHVYAPGIREQPTKMGVWVDVFPIDGVAPHTPSALPHHMRIELLKNLQRSNNYSANSSRGVKALGKRLLQTVCPGEHNRWQKKLDECASRIAFEDQTPGGNITEWDKTYNELKISDFNQAILANFEDRSFYIPRRFDEILRYEYGEYMNLPAESERLTHPIEAYWVNGVDELKRAE